MGNYVYKCSKCGRTEEYIRPTERRHDEYKCGVKLHDVTSEMMAYINAEYPTTITYTCDGKMVFVPVQKTTFKFVGIQ
jgi:hypothetical protein